MPSEARLKVLYVINGLGTGGAERSLAEMLPHLATDGVDPLIACLFARSEGVQNSVLSDGFDVRFIAAQRVPGRVRYLWRLIREEGVDLVHTAIFESDVAGRFGAVPFHLPVVTSLVNTSYEAIRFQDPNIHPWRLRAVRIVDSWTARHLTTHFHAITGAVKRAAVTALRVAPERVTVIERGRDPTRLGLPSPERRHKARMTLGLDQDAEVLVNVGRHEFQKGQRYLVEAMARIVRTRPKAVLLIAGREGNLSSELQGLARERGLGNRLRFLGHREDLPEILAAANVFVFPSLYEGLGGAVIEAMALGLPVVASNLEALREVVEPGKNAVLVPRASPEALASTIEALLDDPHRRSLFGERSRAIFEERFTVERSARRMAALYRRITASPDLARFGQRAASID
jgi:glycosyltransferase involved in cell wall biosynthesis